MIYKELFSTFVTRVIQYFRFPETYERWGHLGFLERGESEKRGIWRPLPTIRRVCFNEINIPLYSLGIIHLVRAQNIPKRSKTRKC